jgi:hypothetical protein
MACPMNVFILLHLLPRSHSPITYSTTNIYFSVKEWYGKYLLLSQRGKRESNVLRSLVLKFLKETPYFTVIQLDSPYMMVIDVMHLK